MIPEKAYVPKYSPKRVKALQQFAFTQTVITVLGHVWFGFEVAYALPIIASLTAISVQSVLGVLRAYHNGETPWFFKSPRDFVTFSLPAHIVAMTCSMFIYPGDRLIWPIVFTVTLAIASKFVFTIPVFKNGRIVGEKHFFNPANIGILTSLVLLPEISIVLPYGFSAYSHDAVDIILPIVVFVLGGLLTLRLNHRWPMVFAWLAAFVAQAGVRSLFFDTNFYATLAPATGIIAILFTFYMAPDPGTSPSKTSEQIVFGASVGTLYGVLTVFHVVFALFWALAITCAGYGAYQVVLGIRSRQQLATKPHPTSTIMQNA